MKEQFNTKIGMLFISFLYVMCTCLMKRNYIVSFQSFNGAICYCIWLLVVIELMMDYWINLNCGIYLLVLILHW